MPPDGPPLSARLAAALALVPRGARLADVGAGHARLALRAVRDGRVPSAVAIDRSAAALDAAANALAGDGGGPSITLRRGDGLLPLAPGEVDAVVCAGLGAAAMVGLLAAGRERLTGVVRLVMVPVGAAYPLRIWLRANGWAPVVERVVYDGGRAYEVVAAAPGDAEAPYRRALRRPGRAPAELPGAYDDALMRVGPVAARRASTDWLRHWRGEVGRWRALAADVRGEGPRADHRRADLSRRAAEVERVVDAAARYNSPSAPSAASDVAPEERGR